MTLKEVQQEVLAESRSETHALRDFSDGQVYKCHPLFGEDNTAFQIIGYYDELEVVNPIGSYVSRHKLGCLFFTLGNIPPKYRSSLMSIHLVAVGKHEDIAYYGIDSFLAPFVSELKTLYCDGIDVNIGGQVHNLHGGLFTLTSIITFIAMLKILN